MSKLKMAQKEKAVMPQPSLASLEAAEEDKQWLLANETTLQTQYLYKYITIRDKKVLFSADTPEEMVEKAKAAGIYLNQMLCSYIQKGKGPTPINI